MLIAKINAAINNEKYKSMNTSKYKKNVNSKINAEIY